MTETLPDTINSKLLHTNPAIKNVWASNLVDELKKICKLAQLCQSVAISTQYPGTVVENSECEFQPGTPDYEYEKIRWNVDRLKILQLGLTFLDDKGNRSTERVFYTTWQFNFKFDIDTDEASEESSSFLINNGISFSKLKEEGIEPNEFGRLMNAVVYILRKKKATWITFNGGIDLLYLFKLLTNEELPSNKNLFFDALKPFFRIFFDIKYTLEQSFGIEITRTSHQAGQDSLMTARLFFAMKNDEAVKYFKCLYCLSNSNIQTHPSRMIP